eukprot:1158656-Pelagomonas_calceolata.AAC.1
MIGDLFAPHSSTNSQASSKTCIISFIMIGDSLAPHSSTNSPASSKAFPFHRHIKMNMKRDDEVHPPIAAQ